MPRPPRLSPDDVATALRDLPLWRGDVTGLHRSVELPSFREAVAAIVALADVAEQLSGYVAWGSGIRRDESPSRADTRVVDWDETRGMLKINPLAAWTQDVVDRYVDAHQVPVNPLVELGYASIGCAPCTRPVAPGEDPRAGRWAGRGKTECGIHV